MYSFIIIELDTSVATRVARVMLEAAGYPTIAATVDVDGHKGHIAITAAPADAPKEFKHAIDMYAALGEPGVRRAVDVASMPEAKFLARQNPRAVPAAQRDTVRNALLHTLYTAAAAEHVTVVTSEPNYSAVPAPVEDVPTVPNAHPAPTKNPEGGGFDGQCIGADKFAPQASHDRYDYWTSPT